MSISSMPSAAQVLRIKNTTNTDQSLWIEPLGDRVTLRSNILYELLGSDEFGKMEIDLSNDGFTVYGWVKKVTALSDQGGGVVQWELPE